VAIRHIEQGNFTAGIVSPRYWGRKDLPSYQAGLAECLNMYPTVEGNLQRRLPTLVTNLRDNTITDGRCIPWNFDDDQSAVVTISKNFVLKANFQSDSNPGPRTFGIPSKPQSV